MKKKEKEKDGKLEEEEKAYIKRTRKAPKGGGGLDGINC